MKNRYRLVMLLTGFGLVVGGGLVTQSSSAGAAQPPTVRQPTQPTLVSKRSISTTPLAQTNCWSGVNDEQLLTWYGAPVTPSQPVAVSASEGQMYAEGAGDAHVYAEGVTVLNSAIQVRVHTGWGAPLSICLHYVG
ncbi:hypothetical protein [Streptomyces violascens]|uniref:Uncharacterized protein n=1 Tax=Streptomyces violascens TaxID=67381 RepID=A0ABQ3QSI4_9ACTN|nr:hypothetical protein [Streptomyces violascens]GGU33132.1 hypothetical protein GCM10010289_62970 [Streptomyces violascens]GHI40238.1 hypothetical protein Sviol_46460 [Streptomyces violascens]